MFVFTIFCTFSFVPGTFLTFLAVSDVSNIFPGVSTVVRMVGHPSETVDGKRVLV